MKGLLLLIGALVLAQTPPPPSRGVAGGGLEKPTQETPLSAEDQLEIRESQLAVKDLEDAVRIAQKRLEDVISAVAKKNGCANVGLRPNAHGKPQLVCIKPPETAKPKESDGPESK